MEKQLLNVIVTAGGTSEPIDNVRRIANTGTGRLGSIIADAFAGEESVGQIFFVCARDSARTTSRRVTRVEIQTVADLQAAVNIYFRADTEPFYIFLCIFPIRFHPWPVRPDLRRICPNAVFTCHGDLILCNLKAVFCLHHAGIAAQRPEHKRLIGYLSVL